MIKFFQTKPGILALVILSIILLMGIFSSKSSENDPWRDLLTEEQYRINRLAGTEPPGSNDSYTYMFREQSGTFYDVTGEQALFHTDDQFDSGTGWPSFTRPISEDAISKKTDYKLIYPRTELLSSKHGHHLGHVFKDGPEPTGLRYCINAAALKFVPDEE